jgi:hypothetical protein
VRLPPLRGSDHFGCSDCEVKLALDEKVKKSWENFLNPDVLRPNLIIASIYITAFELLKRTIVDHIKSFYASEWDKNGPRISPDYRSEILSKNRSPVYASLQWLRENHAIDDIDIAIFDRIKRCRNDLAHEILTMLANGLPSDLSARFFDMVGLIDKVEKWWIVNVEIPTNPDFDGQEVDESTILSGPIMSLRLLTDVALGSDENARRYLDEFVK